MPQPQSRPSGTTRRWPISAREPERAALELAAQHDAATDAGADRDHQQVVDVLAAPEPELAPRGRVGVVLDRDRQVDALLELGLEVEVTPGEVGREDHLGPAGVDVARGTEADPVEVVTRPQVGNQAGDGVLDRLDLGGR